jgi:hypothetical protein
MISTANPCLFIGKILNEILQLRNESIWQMRYSFMIFITLSSKQERRKVFIGF